MKIKQNSTLTNLFWNYGSIVVLAVGGLVFNAIIAAFYSAQILGIFNLVYTYYLLLSQLAVFGVHMSVLRYASSTEAGRASAGACFISGMILAGGLSLAVSGGLAAALLATGQWIEPEIHAGLWALVPALPFFSLNKVILHYLNALSEMKAFAIIQALRNLLITGALIIFALAGMPGQWLPLSFFAAELLLFCLSTIWMLQSGKWPRCQLFELKPWFAKHFGFGWRILPGNFVLEFNTKIDILSLNWLGIPHHMVGYYAFAGNLFEGFYMLFVVVRRNINPMLAKYHHAGLLQKEYPALRATLRKWLTLLSAPAGSLVVLGYYLLCVLLARPEYLAALLPLAIVTASIALTSRSITMGNLLAQTGNPSQESVLNMAAAGSNLLINFILIPYWGITGAALATGLSYFIYAALLHLFAKKKLGLRV